MEGGGRGIGEGLIYSEVNEEKKKSRRVPRTETANVSSKLEQQQHSSKRSHNASPRLREEVDGCKDLFPKKLFRRFFSPFYGTSSSHGSVFVIDIRSPRGRPGVTTPKEANFRGCLRADLRTTRWPRCRTPLDWSRRWPAARSGRRPGRWFFDRWGRPPGAERLSTPRRTFPVRRCRWIRQTVASVNDKRRRYKLAKLLLYAVI